MRVPVARRPPGVRPIESLEDRVLLSADAGPLRPPPLLGLLLLPPSAEIGAARSGDGSDVGQEPFTGPLPAKVVIRTIPVDPGAPRLESGGIDDSLTEAAASEAAPVVALPSDDEPVVDPPPDEIWGPMPPVEVESLTYDLLRTGAVAGTASVILVQDDDGNTLYPQDEFAREAAAAAMVSAGLVEADLTPEFGPPSPSELAGLPRLAWFPEVTYSGSIDAEGTVAVRVPVGPSTRMLTLGLTPEDGETGSSPRIEQVYLIGRRGEILSAVLGVSILGDESGQTLHISLQGAPVGSEIVVRMIPSPASVQEAAPDVSSPEGGGDEIVVTQPISWTGGSFELNVQRIDARSPSSSTSTTIETGSIGTVFNMAGGPIEVGTSFGGSSWANTSSPNGDEPVSVARTTVNSAETRTDVQIEAGEGTAKEEVFLGPLVSRTAAALGPTLATSTEEPTSSTSRGGRSEAGGLEAFGADLDLDAILAIKARGDVAEVVAPGDADPALTTLRGPGGVPIVVAGLRSGDRDRDPEADALAASVRHDGDDPQALAEALAAGVPLDADSEPQVAKAGLATRAVGFLIGMGLASGPLYPDLLALVRRKLKRRPRRSGTSRLRRS